MSRIDTLFSGAQFHTLRTEHETFRFLGVTGGTISYLSDERPEKIRCKKEIQLDGLHVYPSLTDAHLHLMYSIAIASLGFHLCEIRGNSVVPDTIDAVGERLRDYCATRGAGDLIVANSYITAAIKEKRMPTRQELDVWVSGRPAIMYSIDGHSSALSTAMLRMLGIDPDGHTGNLRGTEHDFRQGNISEIIAASINIRDIVRGIAAFINQCAASGITRLCAFDGSGDSPNDTLTKILAIIAPRLGVDVFLYPQYMDTHRARPLWKKMSQRRIGGCGQWQMDGSVGSHSAAFYSPYRDTGETAACYYTQAYVDEMVGRAADAGCQVAAHAIGDAAIDQILAAYEKHGGNALHRIEHGEFPTAEAVEKIITNGNIALAVQPGFAWIDARYLKTYEHYLLPQTILQQVPLKRLYDAGIVLCASSDSPVQNIDPFLQMLGMVDFTIPGQSLDNYQALRCYTVNPARALGLDTQFGTLETGKEASFFACDTDLISAGTKAFSGTNVQCTYIRGKRLTFKKGTLREFCGMMLRRPRKI